MIKYCVIGWPVEHSVSPRMQMAAFDALGIRAVYEKIAIPPNELEAAVDRLRTEFAGWNVTVPHKQAILPLLDELGEIAAGAGSVNTVINRDSRLEGHSTDGYGLAAALRESFGLDIENGHFAFIGAGGAARAAAAYFAGRGAASISVINRTVSKAGELAGRIRELAPRCGTPTASPSDPDRVRSIFENADVIVQATSLGLKANDPMPLNPGLLPDGIPVYDMIYRLTPFLEAASRHGCPVADGATMLLHQGARSFELWTGREAPVEPMRTVLKEALSSRT